MKKALLYILDTLKIVVVALAIVIPIRYFLFQPFLVKGQSMEPNFQDGNYLIVDEISYRFRAPERGEVIIFRYPEDPSQRFVKRIIGLPGETIDIKDGRATITKDNVSTVLTETKYLGATQTAGDVHITLAANEYFVMGDNRNYSYDSRRFGPLPKGNITGRVLIRAWPLSELQIFSAPAY
jgi:signal peptidase I